MPQAPSAAAPPPVTPKTFRNRRRFMPSVIDRARSIVTEGTVATHLVLHVTPDAPPHAQRRHLKDLRHRLHRPVTGDARRGAEGLDVSVMREVYEVGVGVDANPFRRVPVGPGFANFLDLRLVRRPGAADHLVAADTGLQRGNPRLARDRRRIMAVKAGDLVLPGVDVVTEEDRLAGTMQRPRVFDDGSDPAGSGRVSLCRDGSGDEAGH